MSATVVMVGNRRVNYFAQCLHCGWEYPNSGVVSEQQAAEAADRHNRETHGAEDQP